MIKNRKVLLGAVTGCAFAGFFASFLFNPLPHPSDCDRSQLLRWLVQSDLMEQDNPTVVALVDRLQEELANGLGDEVSTTELSNGLKEQIQKNIDFLQTIWFQRRVDQFHELGTENRTRFLDRQIQLVENWPRMDHHDELALFSMIDKVVDQADADQAQRMEDAIAAAMLRWLETCDISNRSENVKRALVTRIDDYLSQGTGIGELVSDSTQPERDQLRENAMLLMQCWFHSQSEKFHNLPEESRSAFVNQRITDLKNWDLQSILTDQTPGSTKPSAIFPQIALMVGRWINEADESKRAQLKSFQAAVSTAVWQQMFSGGQR